MSLLRDSTAGPILASFERPSLKAIDPQAFVELAPAPTPEARPQNDAEAPDEDVDAILTLARSDGGRVDPDAPYVPPSVEAPLITLAPEGGEPAPLHRFYATIVDDAAETMAMLARHRAERRMNERGREEERILQLVDAIAVCRQWVATLLAWWTKASQSPDPWKIWAPVFTLGCLRGNEALAAIARVIAVLPPDAYRHAEIAAEALALAPHPGLRAFAEELVRSPHAPSRAIGIDVLCRAQALPVEEIARHLADPSPPVAILAIRGVLRLAAPEPALVGPLRKAMTSSVRPIAWEAARALALLGDSHPGHEARSNPRFAAALGPKLLEIFIAMGSAADLPQIEAHLARVEIGAGHLDAVARFGHPKSWAFLVHFLADGDLARDAASALELLFGERTPHATRLNASAWRDAIARGGFDGALRYRRGEPWRPGTLVAECQRGRISRIACEAQIFEIAVRARIRPHVSLSLWSPDADATLRPFLVQVERADASFSHGSWGAELPFTS